MNLDVGTLFSVTVMVMALLGVLLIGTWLQNRGMRALAWWGAAYLIGGMSIWMLGARGSVQDLLSIDIANALLFVAMGLTWSGARLFDGRGVKPVAMFIGTFMWVGACQIPGFMASLDARVVLSSIILSGYTLGLALAGDHRACRACLPVPAAYPVRAFGSLARGAHSALVKRLAPDHHSGIAPLRHRIRLHHDGDGEGAP